MEIATRTERWRGRLQGNLYQEQEKWQGDALECSTRSRSERHEHSSCPIVVGRRQLYNCTSLSQALKCLSRPSPPFPLLYSTTACSIENFNLLLHNELCLRFSPAQPCSDSDSCFNFDCFGDKGDAFDLSKAQPEHGRKRLKVATAKAQITSG